MTLEIKTVWWAATWRTFCLRQWLSNPGHGSPLGRGRLEASTPFLVAMIFRSLNNSSDKPHGFMQSKLIHGAEPTWGCRRKCRLRWIPKDMEQRRFVGGCVGPLENNTRKKLLTLCSYILYVLSQHMRPQRVSHLAFTWWLLKLGDHTPIPKDLRKFDYVRIFHGLIGL